MGAYTQRVLELFERLDKDGSGGINPRDLAYVEGISGSRPTPLALGAQRLVQGFVRHSDANKDGQVSKIELLNYVDKAMGGTTPETFPTTSANSSPRCSPSWTPTGPARSAGPRSRST